MNDDIRHRSRRLVVSLAGLGLALLALLSPIGSRDAAAFCLGGCALGPCLSFSQGQAMCSQSCDMNYYWCDPWGQGCSPGYVFWSCAVF